MTVSLEDILLFKPFKDLVEKAKSLLLDNVEEQNFKLGEQLIDEGSIPGRILVIKSGCARSLLREDGKLKNFRKCNRGEIIGAASILNGYACENYTAGENLVAFSIEEEIWEKLYLLDNDFKVWCDSNLWNEEISTLITKKFENYPKEISNLREIIERCFENFELLTIDDQINLDKINNENYVFNLSAIKKSKNTLIPINKLDKSSSNLKYSARYLKIKKSYYDNFFEIENDNSLSIDISTDIKEENERDFKNLLSIRSGKII